MGIETAGKLHTIYDTTKVSERFTKREFVVEIADNPKYPQLVLFQLTGDRCGQLDDLRVGDEVRIEFSLRGREWRSPKGEVKYFNSLDVWKIEPGSAGGGGRRGGGGGGGGGGDPYGDPRGGGGGGRGGGGGGRRGGGGDPRDQADIPPRSDDDMPGQRDDDLPF